LSSPAEPDRGKKVTPRGVGGAIAFILGVQLVAIWLTLLNKPVFQASGFSYAPLGTTTAGSAGSTILLVFVVFAATLVLVWLVRKKMTLSFKMVIFVATSISAFSLTFLTVDSIFVAFTGGSSAAAVELLLAFLPVMAIGYTTFVKSSPVLSSIVLGLLSAEVGSYFAATLPLLTAILLPIAFSLYDIYAVFRGPLKELVSLAPATALGGVSVKVGEFTIGLGDTTFYSMLPALAIFQLAPVSSLFTLGAVDVGVVVTFYFLTKRKLLPGLPIPMALGVAALLIATLV
jgi:hypothetical protein